MSDNLSSQQRLASFLRKRAPLSAIERAKESFEKGLVSDLTIFGPKITAVVLDADQGPARTSAIEIESSASAIARCSCSPGEVAQDIWCVHTIAALWAACARGAFDPEQDPVEGGLALRRQKPSAVEFGVTLEGVLNLSRDGVPERTPYEPRVAVYLELLTQRVGVRVKFDNEWQSSALFATFRRRSLRELDNLLLQFLDNQGDWDDETGTWYISTSHWIGVLFGLLSEFRVVYRQDLTGERLVFERTPVIVNLHLTWLPGQKLEIEPRWALPDGREELFVRPLLIGSGPFWVAFDEVLYPVAALAGSLVQLFPRGESLRMCGDEIGPVLEALKTAAGKNPGWLFEHDTELRPGGEIGEPRPELTILPLPESAARVAVGNPIRLDAKLAFRYTGKSPDTVVLRNPAREQQLEELVEEKGFRFDPLRELYVAHDDLVLDLLQEGKGFLPKEFSLRGLDQLRDRIRLAQLTLNIALMGGEGDLSFASEVGCEVSLLQNNAEIPLTALWKNITKPTQRWVRLDSGAFARVPAGNAESLERLLGLLSSSFRVTGRIRTVITGLQAAALMDLRDSTIRVISDAPLRALSARLSTVHKARRKAASPRFQGSLRPYQQAGLDWLWLLYQLSLGGILADEMGLGKTVQALALLQTAYDHARRSKEDHCPSLVVAPTSVLANWQREAARFTPELRTVVLHGEQRRSRMRDPGAVDLCITSYALLRLDREDLLQQNFFFVILDEGQYIKNPTSTTAHAAKALRAQHRVVLTGTPTENRPLELWSLMDFVLPGYLGNYDFFRTRIERPILELGPQSSVGQELKIRTRPFLLRRQKETVEPDLPPKLESVLHVDMAPTQRALYRSILFELRSEVFATVESKGIGGARMSVLAALMRLRQICNHPRSLAGYEEREDLESGKFALLDQILQEALASNRKVLVFCQFLQMLALIRDLLTQLDVPFCYLDGATRHRGEVVKKFNEDDSIRVFLMSLKAGGLGLNLTAADTVILYDPWWNPAVEMQAVDRTHRIGQTKTVSVYRLVTVNSVEERVMKLKRRKTQLIEALITERKGSPLDLTKKDLEMLFSLSEEE